MASAGASASSRTERSGGLHRMGQPRDGQKSQHEETMAAVRTQYEETMHALNTQHEATMHTLRALITRTAKWEMSGYTFG